MDGRTLAKATMGALLLMLTASPEAADPGPVPSQPDESHADSVKIDARTETLGDAFLQQPLIAKPSSSDLKATGAPEVERRFNELRRELLDDRATVVNWWLAAVAIFLTALGVVAVIAGFFSFREFREIRAKAYENAESSRRHAEEAGAFVEEIRAQRDEAESIMSWLTAEVVQDDPDQARRATERVQKDPSASKIDRAVAKAVQLQQQESFEESIEMWRAVAIISSESDKELAARAWSSVGYLIQEHSIGTLEGAIDAYSKAIQLNPALYIAYNNRGAAKGDLGSHEEAIRDYDESIRLDPNDAITYRNRGNAKTALGRYVEAIDDYGKAMDRKSGYATAYFGRAVANSRLNRVDDARSDFENAIALMRAAGDEALMRAAEKALKEFEESLLNK